MNYKFQPVNIGTQSRRKQSIVNFSGVDYATQRFKVDKNHAIDINNFIYRDGVIQKRFGYEELIKIEPTFYIPRSFNEDVEIQKEYKKNSVNVNGLWHFLAEDNKEHIIAHIGHLLYEIVDFKKCVLLGKVGTSEVYKENIYDTTYEFEDYKSSAFIGANRFYFLGGNKFMVLRFLENGESRFYPVEEHEETYIPTTTISITYKNSGISARNSLDKTNLLTQFRINELLSGTLKQEDEKTKTDFYEYTLDAPLIARHDKDFSDIIITIEERGKIK